LWDGVTGVILQHNDRTLAAVEAYPEHVNQLPFPVADTRTAADGSYELRNLRPGEYYLGINLVRTPSADMPYTRRGELVYEPFLGSGTTLAAAELTERVCCGIELDPK
jgi:hypothetical protein